MNLFKKLKKQNAPKDENVFCECKECYVKDLGFMEAAPLRDGHWTSFSIHKCKSCGKIRGFPHDNLMIALKEGTKETLDELEKAGVPVKAFREDCERDEEMNIDPSER